jgi:type I restriction enzyme S subunit
MRKYDSYKDSGVECIGEIPSSWNVMRFTYLFSFSRGLGITKQDLLDNGIPCVNYGEIHSKYGFILNPEIHPLKCVEETYLKTSDSSLLRRGDFVFADTSEDIEGSGNFTCLDSDTPTFAGYHTVIARHSIENYKFLAYYFDSLEFRNQIRSAVSGIKVYSITQGILKNSQVLLPSPTEQIAIATFLDRKTAEIDELIANKKRLLELYEEEKTAIINQAVTKGISLDVNMRDSGVEWLGEIPEHWQLKRLKYVLAEKLKYGANESAEQENYEHPRYIRITDFGDDGKLRKDTFKSLDPEKANEYQLHEGDILFARSGATVGKTFQFKNYNGEACYAGYLIKATPNPNEMLSDYLYLFTKSGAYLQWKSSIFNQATIQNIGADKYSLLEVPVPKVEEQRLIVKHIEAECARIDLKKEKAEKLIKLLTEYRNALISEVVTGKTKVID